ncbi:MAG: 4-(cytidine 5'-diphospho)-2-C-methyl-D-erythritol kinase, partial [Oscillospiraceae bacterium]|nr:4-(cytidine 5'-diphospho)-2-C-methyl-D-erythritol kinase [Oscillospiraceae bacterium]
MKLETKAYAKLNLALDVLHKRPDGYHDLRMVMQTVSLCDDVSLDVSAFAGVRGAGITLRSGLRHLPTDMRNTAVKAADVFLRRAGIQSPRVKISLRKAIPTGAGLGGGSADAAAVLRALNVLFGTDYSPETLMELGLKVGSDVPFCLFGGAALAESRGEKLTRVQGLEVFPECRIVIVKPPFSISTPALFQRLDLTRVRLRPDTDGLLGAIAARDLPGAAHRMFNVFEDALPARERTQIADLKSRLIDSGALGAIMTGTGSAVFGIFSGKQAARRAQSALSEKYKEAHLAPPRPPAKARRDPPPPPGGTA